MGCRWIYSPISHAALRAVFSFFFFFFFLLPITSLVIINESAARPLRLCR